MIDFDRLRLNFGVDGRGVDCVEKILLRLMGY